MRTKLIMTAALAAVIGLSSCGNEDARLAGELAGTWKGSATEMTNGKKDKPDKGEKGDRRHDDGDRGQKGRPGHDGGDFTEMTCTPTFTFVRTDGTNGGTVEISADYTLTKGVETVAAAVPVKATVNGTVRASGTWTVKDGDEVVLTLDPSGTAVTVDTASTVLAYAQLTDAPQDSLAAIRARVVPNMESVIRPMLEARVMKMRKLDDVKITGDTMTLEAGHARMTFTR